MVEQFDEIYSDVPVDQREELRQFRETHPVEQIKAGGQVWRYIESGDPQNETVLLLVGGLRVADAAYRSIPMLEDEFHVLTPTYPALDNMSAIADGLAALLDAKQIDKVNILGGSFGGMIAQVFVRRHPARVESLILSSTGLLDDESLERYRQGVALFSPLPPEQVSTYSEQVMFDLMGLDAEWEAFYRAFLHELYHQRLSKAEVVTTYQAIVDYGENYHFTASDLANWPGRTLILESDNDTTFGDQSRSAVRAIYPHAQTHIFKGAGHSPSTNQREAYFQVVKSFLS